MKTFSVRALLPPLLAGGLAAAEPARLAPDQAAPLRAERQIAVQIKQVYSWQEVDDEGNVKEETTDDPNAEKKPRDLLPLAEETTKALSFAGWRPAPAGATARVKLELMINGAALGGEYTGTVSGYQYSGAQVLGHAAVLSAGVELLSESIFAKYDPPYSVNQFYPSPWSAPFGLLTKDCLAAVYRALDAVHGPGPLLAAVNSDDSLHRESAAMALCQQAEPSLQPALLELLRRGDGERRAIAAALLGIVGDERALTPLLEALRATAAEENPEGNYNDYEWEELMRFEHEPAERGTRRHSAPSLARGPAHDAVRWALLQIPAPDKTARLVVALGDRGLPPAARCGIALVLGRWEDPAVAPALAAATRDSSPLVRAAALTGLKHHRFHDRSETGAAVLAATTDRQARVRALAREVAAEYAPGRSLKHTDGKYGRDITRHPPNLDEELLSHPDPFVRLSAVRTAAYGGREAIMAAARLLRTDPAPVVREAVVKLLAEHRPEAHAEDFAIALTDRDESTRLRALQALKDAGNPAAADEGEEAKPLPLPKSALAPLLGLASVPQTAADAIDVLARVQGDGVNDTLLAAAQRAGADASMREAAMIELARRGDRRATALLAAFLAAGEPVARSHLWPLTAGPLDDEALVDPLIKILRQGPEGSQALAAEVLGAMSHTRAVGPMIVALRSARERNRQDLSDRLSRALENLTGQQFYGPDEWLAWWKQNAGKPIIRPKAAQ